MSLCWKRKIYRLLLKNVGCMIKVGSGQWAVGSFDFFTAHCSLPTFFATFWEDKHMAEAITGTDVPMINPSRPFNLPMPPTFESVEEERLHRKQRLAAAFRLFAKFGFDEGVAGHITARDPERSDHFWVNPFGMDFGQIRVSDLVLVNHKGEVVEGEYPVNVAAFAIHSSVHAARPDCVAAAHAHSMYGKSWSALGRPLDPITQDACAFYEDPGLFDGCRGLVSEP